MPVDQVKCYEGLFLFPQSAASDLQSAVDHLKEILARAEVKIISLRKWDERRLAFEIKKNRRGLFFLVYFEAAPNAIAHIERDCNLSEQVLRSMVLRAEHLTREQMEAADGQIELADEIKLRDTEVAAVPAPPTDRSQDDAPGEPPVTVTKTAEDMPAALDA
ncbi:MAG: 30S ribosomal protein S6 [Planctomycetes bacterium]|nr:30S ribosomal protein S6 [Planctomycetota bacterium]MCH8260289.1 30S ribosomal protein S6 [Planctomycetota bacterium]